MRNKYAGWCAKCRQRVEVGAGECERGADGKWVVTHAGECPRAPEGVALAGGPPRATAKTNRKAGECERCGEWIEVGKGMLVYCIEDSGCPKHHDFSGYHLYCAETDSEACGARRAKLLAERRAQRAAEEERQRRYDALREKIVCAEHHTLDGVSGGERHVLWGNAAGSITLQITDDAIWWTESSCDDYHSWSVPRTPELEAEVRAVVAEALGFGAFYGR